MWGCPWVFQRDDPPGTNTSILCRILLAKKLLYINISPIGNGATVAVQKMKEYWPLQRYGDIQTDVDDAVCTKSKKRRLYQVGKFKRNKVQTCIPNVDFLFVIYAQNAEQWFGVITKCYSVH